MNDEQTNATDTKGNSASSPVQNGNESLSIVDEAKKVRDEIKAENDRREKILQEEQKLKANEMLGGTTGGHVEPTPPKEETAAEYTKRVMSGGLNGTAKE